MLSFHLSRGVPYVFTNMCFHYIWQLCLYHAPLGLFNLKKWPVGIPAAIVDLSCSLLVIIASEYDAQSKISW